MQHYTEHSEYPLYKEKIDQLLKDGFPKKSYSRSLLVNHYTDKPLIKSIGQLSTKEKEFRDLIGQKKGLLTISGFYSDGTLSPKLNPIVCQCDCGAYCIIKLSNFLKANLILACSECSLIQHGFSEQFWLLHQIDLNDQIVNSIFGGENLSLDVFVDNLNKGEISQNPIRGLSIDQLKILTNQYNAYSIDFFPLSEDRESILNPKIFNGGLRKNLVNCYVRRPELLDINDVPAQLHNRNLSQIIGTRINRIQIIGILKTDNIHADYTTNKATLVTRCDCGTYSFYNFKTLHKPEKSNFYRCSRCQFLENEIIRRENELHGEVISQEKAWQILGFNQSTQIVDQKKVIHSDVSNAYKHEIKRYEKEAVPEYHKKYFGLRFGFIVVSDKARRLDLSGNGNSFAVATCDCGQECYFPYKQLNLNNGNHAILACSKCTVEINTTFHKGKESLIMGSSTTVFNKKWNYYLFLFNYPKGIEFNPIWRAYLLMKKKNPDLSFKLIVNKLIDASIRFKANQNSVELNK
jgi:predicted SprT family Zn-dependent metalloprotease